MDQAKRGLIEVLRGLASNESEDVLTLLLTSQPDAAIVQSEPITQDSIEQLAAEIEQLQPSDKTADLDVALQEVQQIVSAVDDQLNRVVYLLSDMRQRDWRLTQNADDQNHPVAILRRIAEQASGCFVMDAASQQHSNLIITQIRPESTLIADVMSRFDVTVSNTGDEPVEQLRVRLATGDAIPLQEEIDRIEPRQSATVQFNVQFAPEDDEFDSDGSSCTDRSDELAIDQTTQFGGHRTTPVRMTAQVISDAAGQADQLPADSQRFFAAGVARGIPTLVVDGDPSAVRYRSESFFLRPALDPPGNLRSGIVADVVTETEMESVNLAGYQVIFLCNVYRLADSQVESLQQWTRAGGGLVILPGDQVDDDQFNRQLFNDGKGLSPLRLDNLQGDESHQTWANFRIEQPIHLVLRIFEDQNNPFLDRVKIFRWWQCSTASDPEKPVSVLARLTDDDDSVAIAERFMDAPWPPIPPA